MFGARGLYSSQMLSKQHRGEAHRLWNRTPWNQILTLPFSSCVTLNKLLNLFKRLRFFIWKKKKNEDNKTACPLELLYELNETMHIKYLASSPVHNKPGLNVSYDIITTAIIISGLSHLKKLFHVHLHGIQTPTNFWYSLLRKRFCNCAWVSWWHGAWIS